MPEIHLRQQGFTNSAYGPFTKNKERIETFKVTGDLRYISQNELDKDCFQHNKAYGDFIELTRRTLSDKFLRDKAFNIATNCYIMDIKGVLLQRFIIFLIKNLLVVKLGFQVRYLS